MSKQTVYVKVSVKDELPDFINLVNCKLPYINSKGEHSVWHIGMTTDVEEFKTHCAHWLKAVELPGEEEIEKEFSRNHAHGDFYGEDINRQIGAKWLRDRILEGK